MFARWKFKANTGAKQGKDGTDVLIVKTAPMPAKTSKNVSVIVGNDAALLVIMTLWITPNMKLFSLKPGKGKMEQNISSSNSLEGKYKEHILFLHAFSVCEETFSTLPEGKSAVNKLLQKSPDLRDATQICNERNVSHALKTENCIKFCCSFGIYEAFSKKKGH